MAEAARCTKCGGPLRRDNRFGICHRNPECAREANRLIARTPEGRARQRAWNKRPEARARQKAANSTPEARARRTVWHVAYRARPEIRARETILSIRSRGFETDLTVEYLTSIYTGRCSNRHCDKTLRQGNNTGRGDSPSLDRIIPASGYTQGNVQWLCGTCNSRKRDMTAQDMLAMLLDQMHAEGKSWADLVEGRTYEYR